MVREIATYKEFQELLSTNTDKLVVVDFTATWCGPCQKIAPIIQSMSDEYTGVVFVKVDVDSNSETAEKCNISSMPTFHFYKNQELVHQFSGASDAKLLKAVTEYQ